ncbi:MAG: FemAB family PEP-CTERM system-associated protein [Kordiimonadaceae bacterium]|nr:FemAB family PEP-CTERM system-associated protein [Kordiimonadaceae bacterium]
MPIKVCEVGKSDYAAWDIYVRAHIEGTFCHLSGWKTVVERGAGHSCPFFVAKEGDKIVGVLPLTFRKSRLFGNALISSMFAVYGGVLADSSEAHTLLEEAAWHYAQSNGLDIVSYRTIKSGHAEDIGWAVDTDSAATFIKPLKETPEDILLDIPRKQRAVVRKTLKNGLQSVWGTDVGAFYKLYAESVRNLGTPVFPKRLFEELLAVFGDAVEIQLVKTEEGHPIASLMSFYFKDTVLPYYAGGSPLARKFGAHDFMYYDLMLRAAEKGKTVFDFGRSKSGSGPYKFKKNWGFEPLPLEYQHQVAPGAAIANLSPTNKKFSLMVDVWKKLPLPLANLLGPPIARHLG